MMMTWSCDDVNVRRHRCRFISNREYVVFCWMFRLLMMWTAQGTIFSSLTVTWLTCIRSHRICVAVQSPTLPAGSFITTSPSHMTTVSVSYQRFILRCKSDSFVCCTNPVKDVFNQIFPCAGWWSWHLSTIWGIFQPARVEIF